MDTVTLMSGCAGYGVLCLVAPEKMAGTLKQLPSTLPLLPAGSWFGLLLAMATSVVAAGVSVESLRHLLIERAGRVGLFGVAMAFLIWTLAATGSRAFGLAIFLGPVLMGSSARRVWVITRYIRSLRRRVRGG